MDEITDDDALWKRAARVSELAQENEEYRRFLKEYKEGHSGFREICGFLSEDKRRFLAGYLNTVYELAHTETLLACKYMRFPDENG